MSNAIQIVINLKQGISSTVKFSQKYTTMAHRWIIPSSQMYPGTET